MNKIVDSNLKFEPKDEILLNDAYKLMEGSENSPGNIPRFMKAITRLIELERRSSLRIEESSKRYAKWSLILSILVIIITIVSLFK